MRPLPQQLAAALASAACAVGCGDGDVPGPAAAGATDPCVRPADALVTPPVHTPRWAFEPWISKDISDRDDTFAFVQGFADRDIPVGVVVLDSPWETNYNSLIPSPSRYPDFADMVAKLGDRGVRLVLWTTQMINEHSFDFEVGGDVYEGPSENFDEAQRCGYFVNEGELYGWWKGTGGALDFDDPSAAAWWHRQQDALFDAGVSGFKLDFGDSYVRTDTVVTGAGTVPHQRYSERYYEDFFAYGVAERGADEFVTMVRPWDESYDFAGRFYARKEHAPVAWVGDNRRDWVGLADALDHIFRSAAAGYVVLGSDIGGYLDRDDKGIADEIPFSADVFQRWTALGALTPFMQLHGRANLAPWTVPERADETVDVYRYWATLHHELVPFFYALAEAAYASGAPGATIVRPVDGPDDWPGDYRFRLGDAFLVAPILDDTGKRDVALPAGTRWYDWWAPADDARGGGQIVAYDATTPGRIPLFVAAGAIVPMDVASDVTGLGSAASSGHTTVLVYPDALATRMAWLDADGAAVAIDASDDGAAAHLEVGASARPLLLRVRADAPAMGVTVDGGPIGEVGSFAELGAAGSAWLAEPETRSTWIRLPAAGVQRRVAVER